MAGDRSPGTPRTFDAADNDGWRPHVLVGEDDGTTRRALADALAREGYEVSEARDGFELFDLLSPTLWEFEPTPYDLIVAERSLPGWTGLEILRGLRRCDWATPFLVMSRQGGSDVHDEAFRWRAFVFDHPVGVAELVDYVRCLLPPPGAIPPGAGDDLMLLEDLTVERVVWDLLEEQLRRDGLIKALPVE